MIFTVVVVPNYYLEPLLKYYDTLCSGRVITVSKVIMYSKKGWKRRNDQLMSYKTCRDVNTVENYSVKK